MGQFFLILFGLTCLILIIRLVDKPALIFEFPYFMGGIFFAFILPQAVMLSNNTHIIPEGSFPWLMLMCFLCLFMVVVGYKLAPPIAITKTFDFPFDFKKLKTIGIIYVCLGYLFLFLITRSLSQGEVIMDQQTGILTIYIQFFQIIFIGFSILLLLTFKHRSAVNIFLLIFSSLPILYLIIFSGRREVTTLFFVSIALTLYFRYRLVPPRILVIGTLLFALLIIPAVGEYRALVDKKGPSEAIKSLNLINNFKSYFQKAESLELEVAANVIDSYSLYGNYDYGAGYWNNMVFRYVPGQLLGYDFKQSLMINEENNDIKNGFKMGRGLTLTGVGESFTHFGVFGCIFFFFLGGFFKQLWKSSILEGNPIIQIFYMFCLVQALLTVTHGTSNFFPGVFFTFICLLIAARYSKASYI